MAKQIVGLDKARAFWGLAKHGKLITNEDDVPVIWVSLEAARIQAEYGYDGGKPVKVYVLVEDE